MARHDAAASGPDRGPVRVARADGAPSGVSGPLRVFADLGVPRAAVHGVSAADPNRLHRPEPEDQLHAPLQRIGAAPALGESGGGSGLHRQDRQGSGGPQLLQRRAVHQLADHRTAAVAAERRAARAVQPGRHQRAVAGARQLLPQHLSQHAAEGRAPHGSNLLVLRLLRALEEPDEPAREHTGTHQQHPESVRSRVALGAVVPRSPARRRRVMGLEPAVQDAQRGRWARC